MSDTWPAIQAAASRVLAPKTLSIGEPPRYAMDRALRVVRAIDRLAPLTGDFFERLDLARAASLYATVANCGCHVATPPPAPDGNGHTRHAGTSKPGDDQAHNDAAELAADHLKTILSSDDLDLLVRILREHRRRNTALAEARILADALCLEEFGLIGFWHQLRAFHAANKSPDQLLKFWKTQHEYGYWQSRLREGFHYDASRAAAAARLEWMKPLFDRLQVEQMCEDLPDPAALEARLDSLSARSQ